MSRNYAELLVVSLHTSETPKLVFFRKFWFTATLILDLLKLDKMANKSIPYAVNITRVKTDRIW